MVHYIVNVISWKFVTLLMLFMVHPIVNPIYKFTMSVCLWRRFWGVGEGRSWWNNGWPVATRVNLWQDVILPSHYGFFAVVTRFATSQFERELFDISSHHIMFWKQNFHNINSIKSFLIFPAGSLFSRFLRIATVIRTRAFWYFQPSHYDLKTKFSQHQFH
jgi:hypothetical protein